MEKYQRCYFCNEIAVDDISFKEFRTRMLIAASPSVALEGIRRTLGLVGDKSEVHGELVKCTSCKAYHVLCKNCNKVSPVQNPPNPFDTIKCRHCSKTMVVDKNTYSGIFQ